MAEWLVILKSGKAVQFRSELDMHEKETFKSGTRVDVELLVAGKYVKANIQIDWNESAFLARVDEELPTRATLDRDRVSSKLAKDMMGRIEAEAEAAAMVPVTHVSCSVCWHRYQKQHGLEVAQVDAPLDYCCFCGTDLDTDAGEHRHFVAPAKIINCVGSHPTKERTDGQG